MLVSYYVVFSLFFFPYVIIKNTGGKVPGYDTYGLMYDSYF